MSRLEEIKNEIAEEYSYKDWNHLREFNQYKAKVIENYMDEVSERYAKEVAIASLEEAGRNAKVTVKGILTKESKELFTLFDKGFGGVVRRKVYPNKESITQESNILML